MLNFILSTEAACDLSLEQAKEQNISVLPMSYFINEIEYRSDDPNMTLKMVCDEMRKGAKTKTSQPNEYEAEEYFKKLLEKGQDILHVSFSGGQSGTAETMRKVAEKLNATSENKIYTVDSLCQSLGVALLLYMAKDKAEKENLSAKETAEYLEGEKRGIAHSFIVDSLTYLARGGRVSKSSAIIGNIVNIKPVLHLEEKEGKIVMLQKVFGRNRSIKTILQKFRDYYNGKFNTVFVSNADCLKEAEYVKAELLKINPELNVIIDDLGTVITCHSGPGTMAIYYTVDSRANA